MSLMLAGVAAPNVSAPRYDQDCRGRSDSVCVIRLRDLAMQRTAQIV